MVLGVASFEILLDFVVAAVPKARQITRDLHRPAGRCKSRVIWRAFGTEATTKSRRVSKAATPSTIGRKIRWPRSRRGARGGRHEARGRRRDSLVAAKDRESAAQAIAAGNVCGPLGALGCHRRGRRQHSYFRYFHD